MLGKNQTQKAGQIIRDIHFDIVYCSDYKRCLETYDSIEPLLNYKPNRVCYSPLLRERDPGDDQMKKYINIMSDSSIQ